jgi:hypothetical protein
MSKATPRINPQEYKTKAEAVLDMLKKGLSVKQIRNHMAVSESYIYLAKKKLAEAGLAAAEAAEEAVNEALHNITQGRQKYRGTMERKVPGGPAKPEPERAEQYGSFMQSSARLSGLRAVCTTLVARNEVDLYPDQAEGIGYDCFTKVSRIVNGDPNHIDSWIDIAGYATLVADRLQGKTDNMTAWSYSSIKTFDQCPKKYFHLKVIKDVKDIPGEAADLWDRSRMKLPSTTLSTAHLYQRSLLSCDPSWSHWLAKEGEKHTELKLGVRKTGTGYEPTTFFDKDVWWRGIVDLLIVNDRLPT